MKKTLLLSLLVFVAVFAAAYSISWYLQASHIKQNVEQAIAVINTKQSYVTYTSVETSGFPSQVTVSIQNPHFSGRIDTLLKELASQGKVSDNPRHQENVAVIETLPEWNMDIALEGDISFSVNAMANRYSIKSSGIWKNTSTTAGESVSMTATPAAESMCTISLSQGGGLFNALWDTSVLFTGEKMAERFRMFDCVFPAYEASNAQNNEVVFVSGGGRIYLSNAPAGDTTEARAFLEMKDVEILPAGNAIVAHYMKFFSPYYTPKTLYSVYGKQNVAFDLSYRGPVLKGHPSANASFDVVLNKFEITNQIYNSKANLTINNTANDNQKAGKFVFKAVSAFGEGYDAVFQDFVRGAIYEMHYGSDPEMNPLKAFTQSYEPEQTYAMIAPAIPSFHSLGTLVQAVDVSYQGTGNPAAYDINLADLELSSSLYGITGKGSAKLSPGQFMPAGNLNLACNNCLRMIDDIAAYVDRLEKVVASFSPENATNLHVSPALFEGVKRFLSELGLPAISADTEQSMDKTSFTYLIESDPAGGVTVNRKPMAEVMELFNRYIEPALQEPGAQTPPG